MKHVLFILLSLLFLLGCCAFALICGRKAEKLGAACILGANVLAEFIIGFSRSHYPATSIFILDFMLALALLGLAIRYSSLWLGCAMILQGIGLYTHVLGMMGDEVSYQLYIGLIDTLSYSMAICILIGTVSYQLKRHRSIGLSV